LLPSNACTNKRRSGPVAIIGPTPNWHI
jgi:hypothetical protein